MKKKDPRGRTSTKHEPLIRDEVLGANGKSKYKDEKKLKAKKKKK
jgi:hypothetical protein